MPDSPLAQACALAARYLDSLPDRHVGGRADRQALRAALGGPLPDRGADPAAVLDALARDADAGLVATAGPRYYGFVTGGALPVTVAADWLASAWDQNGAMEVMSPAVAVLEDIVAGWIIDLVGLPRGASVGFVTGAHMANFTCLAAARHGVLRRAGWNVEEDGLQRAPRLTVIAGDHVHVSVVGALRMLGVGAAELVKVAVDDQGRMRLDALDEALSQRASGPLIVCAQAGNVASGATDPLAGIARAAHERGAWVHIDGAFGLWAAVVPELQDQVDGLAEADSWTTDAHKWLNVPYDSGLAIVAHPAPHRAAMSLHASYLERGDGERAGMDWTPESSRRARVVPLYALLRTLGRDGVVDLVRRTCALAGRMAEALAREPGISILNRVVLNQVLVRFTAGGGDAADDALTREVIRRVQADGTCWAGGASWFGRQVMRISVCNWSTTGDDIDRSAEAIAACYAAARSGRSSSSLR
ncbi:MAG: aminotransferase class V-fold PLP-dependent enzyme [Acidobacteriota bacterium]